MCKCKTSGSEINLFFFSLLRIENKFSYAGYHKNIAAIKGLTRPCVFSVKFIINNDKNIEKI